MRFDLSDFISKFIIIAIVINTSVHEMAHIAAAALTGHYAEIRSTALNKASPVWSPHVQP